MENQGFFNLNAPEACILLPMERWEQEVSHELTLPDYIPDNARPLLPSAELRLTGWGAEAGELFARGELRFSVVTADGEGVLRTVRADLPLEMRRELAGEGEFSASLPAMVDGILCRPVSPRKFALRCRVSIFPLVWQSRAVLPEVTGGSLAEMERDEMTAAGAILRQYAGEGIQVSEDIEVESGLPAVSEVISAGISPVLNDLRPGAGGIDFAGEGILRVLYRGEDGGIHVLIRRLPLSGNLAGPAEGGEFVGWASAYDLRVQPELNSYGERRVLEVDFTYDAAALSAANGEFPVVNDLYCVGAQTVVERGNLPLQVLKRGLNTNFSVNASKERAECGAEEAKSVVVAEVSLSVPVWSADEEKKRMIMEAEAAVTMLCADEGGAILPVSFSAPVRFELDGLAQLPMLTMIRPANVRGRLDSGAVYCDFEVMAAILQWESAEVSLVTAAAVSREGNASARLPIVLCYPRPGQRLWEIAKHYNTTVTAVAAANHLSVDEVAAEKVLLIPYRSPKKAFGYFL